MPSPPSPVSILFRFWFLLHSLLEGRKNSTRHPSTLRPYRPENLSIVRKENRNIHSENTILEESTKWLDGKRVGRIVESRAMCRGELGDLISWHLGRQTTFSSLSPITAPWLLPDHSPALSIHVEPNLRARSVRSRELRPRHLPTISNPKESSSVKAFFETVPPFLTGYGQKVLEKFCIRPGIDRPRPKLSPLPQFLK